MLLFSRQGSLQVSFKIDYKRHLHLNGTHCKIVKKEMSRPKGM
jgi:hypothetical protein